MAFWQRAQRKANRAQVLDTATFMGGSVSPHFKDYQSYLKAYKLPWVKACVGVIAYNCANVDYSLINPAFEPGDDKRDIKASPLLDLLQHPNPYQTRFQLFEALWTDLELVGNAFMSLEELNGRGQPAELYRLRPDAMTVIPSPEKKIKGYSYSVNGRKVDYEPEEIVHFRYPNPLDDLYGMGTIEAGEARFDSEMAMAEHERQFWRNGAKITGVLSTDNTLDESVFTRLRDNIRRFFTGSGYSTLMVEQGLKYQSVSDGPAKLGMLEMATASRDMILAMFGVPPTKVGIIESANYKAAAADEFFWDETIDPKLTRMEQDLGRMVDLFHPGQGYAIHFDRLNFADDQDAAAIAKTMAETYAFTINEIRQYQGKPPLDEGGDVILAPATSVPVDLVGGLATINEIRKNQGQTPIEGGDDTILLKTRAVAFNLQTGIGTTAPKVPAPMGEPTKSAHLKLVHTSTERPATAGLVRRQRDKAEKRGAQHYTPKLQTFFAEQERRVKAALAGYKRRKAAIRIDGVFGQDEDDYLSKVLDDLYLEAMQAAYDGVKSLVDVSFDLENPRLAAFKDQLAKRVVGINDTTRTALDEQLNEGLRRGYSIQQIAEGVEEETYPGIAGVFAEAKESRAITIARTETATAFNGSAIVAYHESGVVDEVEVLDGTDDTECAAANGEIWSLEEAAANPTQHPRCVRAFAPIVKTGRTKTA